MTLKAEKFYRRTIGDSPPFRRWPFRAMAANRERWRIRASTTYVWINALDSRSASAEVHSGTRLHSKRRINKRSKPRRLLFYLALPPYRNYSTASVKNRMLAERTLTDKCMFGARYALDRGLCFCVLPEIAEQLRGRGLHVDDAYLLMPTNA
jgi:hypothetical protein